MKYLQLNLGAGLKIGVPHVNDQIFKRMNVCDGCGTQGEIQFNLYWIKERSLVLCKSCKDDPTLGLEFAKFVEDENEVDLKAEFVDL